MSLSKLTDYWRVNTIRKSEHKAIGFMLPLSTSCISIIVFNKNAEKISNRTFTVTKFIKVKYVVN